jgi:hypothetical protein
MIASVDATRVPGVVSSVSSAVSVTVIRLEVDVYPVALTLIVVLLLGKVKVVACPLEIGDGRVTPVALRVTGTPRTSVPLLL